MSDTTQLPPLPSSIQSMVDGELSASKKYVGNILQRLQKNGIEPSAARVLDVGCGYGNFIQEMHTQGVSCWGCEYNKLPLNTGFENGTLTEADKERILTMPFSQIPKYRPELKGTFDAIKITGVTDYADNHEMRHMLATAHWLLKKEGALFIELPASCQMGKTYRENDRAEAIATYHVEMRNQLETEMADPDSAFTHKKMQERGAFRQAYRTLIDLHFKTADSFLPTPVSRHIVAEQPREKIPKPDDIKFYPLHMKLELKGSAQKLLQEVEREKQHAKPAPTASAPLSFKSALREAGALSAPGRGIVPGM